MSDNDPEVAAERNEGSDEHDTERGVIGWMARNTIAANLLMLLLLGAGIWTALRIQKEVFPQFQLDVVAISVQYPGASPAEVEKGILLPLEEAIRGVRGIKEITSTAQEGSGSVSVELLAGTDHMRAFQDVDQAVSRIRTFPEDTEEPEVTLEAQQREVMELGLYGDVDVWTLRQLAERLRDRLLGQGSITQVELGSVPEYVTHVEIPLSRLRKYELTLGDVARVIAESSKDIPAGAVSTHAGEILLRMKERKQWAEEFGRITVLTADSGAPVTLAELATITDGFEEVGFHSQFNQQPSIELQVYRLGEQSPLEIADAVREVIDEFQQSLPEGVEIRIDNNAARDYQDRLSLLVENGFLAIVIVLGILALFLELRLAFWVMMGMSISFLGGLVFLPFLGVSINMISMFGFLVAMGIVVDDAIVVGENAFEHRERGMAPLRAAVLGATEMARPVTFSILTSIMAFVPLLLIPGPTGKYWWPLPVVVIAVLVVSLLEALFILPAHLGHTSRRPRLAAERWLRRHQAAFSQAVTRVIDSYYGPLLARALRNRYLTLSAAIATLMIVGGYGYSGHMGMIMLPEVAADEIEAGVSLPVGTTPKQAAKVANAITESTLRMFEEHDLYRVAEGVKTNVRRQNFIDVEIVMKPPDQRAMTAREVIALWRSEIGDIEGVDQITFEAERGPGGYAQDISVDLSHSDIDVLEEASRTFLERMKRYESTRDVTDNYNKGKLQLNLELLPEGHHLGLTPQDVGQQVRDAFFGALALRQLRGTSEIEVRVKLPEAEREDIRYLEDFVVRTPDGTEVPLLSVAKVEQTEAFTSITRRNGRRVVAVSMDAEPTSAMTRLLEAIERDELPELRASFPGLTWSFEGTQAEMRESTQALWGGFALVLGVIYSLLAIAFRSYMQPLIVLIAIPFGVIGAVIGHILLGYDLSLVSLMGTVALSGVVLNDALIMIDYANRRRSGHSAFEVIHQAGIRRFRPILLTTLTTFGGLSPIILETSNQANHLIPMAISLGFGILFATAIVLLLVPSLYLIFDDLHRLVTRPGKHAAAAPGATH